MPATTVFKDQDIETPDETKERQNAEYLAMLEDSFQQLERGEIVSMTFAEWEEWLKNGRFELYK